MFSERLTTAEIQALFAAEIAGTGGKVSDVFDDGRRLFARSIFPWVREVRAKDNLQGGVALRATEEECSVHPYVFRQVCRNGAIVAHSLESQRVIGWQDMPVEEATESLREAIVRCCVEEPFLAAVDEIREVGRSKVDLALTLLPMLGRVAAQQHAQIMGEIVRRFFDEGDRTAFGLMNAVTSTARDTRDPELRWRLEELGGSIPALVPPRPKPQPHREGVELAG
jgi:hypothetical protein